MEKLVNCVFFNLMLLYFIITVGSTYFVDTECFLLSMCRDLVVLSGWLES